MIYVYFALIVILQLGLLLATFFLGWKIRGMMRTSPSVPVNTKKVSWNAGNLLDPISSVEQRKAQAEKATVYERLLRIQEESE